MNIRTNVSLSDFSTMRLGGNASHLIEIYDRNELLEALSWASAQSLPTLMIGGGSNIIWRDEGYEGVVLANKIAGYNVEEQANGALVTIGAGENWDSVVARTVQAGLTGIEALSLIPGTTGATPVQNVGAYGQEIAQTLVSVEAFDIQSNDFVHLNAAECDFGYRNSRFKNADRGRFFITSITLQLAHGNPELPFYPGVTKYFESHDITEYTPQTMRDAVIAIRSAKLPDPAVVANNGSFFANPIVSQSDLERIQAISDVEVPHWPTQEGLVKLAAAWLVEQAGFKDYHDSETGMATWANQSLVLVNESATNTNDLLKFKQKITAAVADTFGVSLIQEPELLP